MPVYTASECRLSYCGSDSFLAFINYSVGTMSCSSKTAIRISRFCDLVIDLDGVSNPSSKILPVFPGF